MPNLPSWWCFHLIRLSSTSSSKAVINADISRPENRQMGSCLDSRRQGIPLEESTQTSPRSEREKHGHSHPKKCTAWYWLHANVHSKILNHEIIKWWMCERKTYYFPVEVQVGFDLVGKWACYVGCQNREGHHSQKHPQNTEHSTWDGLRRSVTVSGMTPRKWIGLEWIVMPLQCWCSVLSVQGA